MSPSFPPNDPTTPEGIANAVKSLAAKDHDADLSGIKATVERAEAERKARIVKALAGVADLEIIGGTKGRRFVLVYWNGGEAKTTQGVEYPVESDEDGHVKGYSVYLDDYCHPFNARYETMKSLRETLDNAKTPYHIAYFDK